MASPVKLPTLTTGNAPDDDTDDTDIGEDDDYRSRLFKKNI